MNESEPLRNLLENMARGYAGREIPVKFDEQPRIAPDGSELYVWSSPGDVLGLDLDGANEFRMIRDALNHECAHDVYSNLEGKAEFGALFEEYSNVAMTVQNICEDAYIDSRRLSEYPGLRQAHAFFAESQLRDADVSEEDTADALVKTIHYYALGGRVPGIQQAGDDVRAFAAWVKPHLDAVRYADDVEHRERLMARIVERLVEDLPDRPDDDVLDDLDDMTSGEMPDDAEVESVEAADIDTDDVADSLPDMDDAPEDLDPADGDDAEGSEEDGDADGDESGESGDEGDEETAEGGEGQASDEDTEAESDDESGENGSGGSDLDDELSELDERDERDESTEHHGVDPSEDYEEADDSDERRYERIEDRADYHDVTDMGRRQAERDERSEQQYADPDRYDATSDEVRQVLRESGLAREVRQAFEKFATLDVTERSETGDRLNAEAAVRHMSGDYSETAVYETDYTADPGGRAIGVALDLSGSMENSGSELVNDLLEEKRKRRGAVVDAKVALGAVHLAAHELGDELVASGFQSGRKTPLITGPGESFEWDHLDAVTSGGSTPTAAGILDTLSLVREQGGRDEVMLVVTDGDPRRTTEELPSGNATEQATMACQLARSEGVGVIGVGVGTGVSEQKMAKIFGEDGYVMTDSDTLVDELVEVYADELDYERPAGY